ncbi:glyoxalase [Gordoniibacillus kamchatkensis]|uniref:Glyoxalase n=1 Tax=Gordoniibacillus kamchatkensis TaxID=1590651 RepID=A0ABR5AN45_9BACL|nr:VOC family protein [Paenibacillus sp. VKM B-2647]KIL42448.1 glyoxalase [Paenibacillus sp. VKM B-2647]
MNLGSTNVNVITLFVEDLQRSREFYRHIFGMSAVYEDENSSVFNFGNMSINLLKISEAYGLIAPRKVASLESGSRFQFTIFVEDVDEVCSELKAKGLVLLSGPINRPWGVRTITFSDPAGHVWEIAQQLS